MPDRYGDDGDSVVDFDSRRQAREAAAVIEAARLQRERIAESRAAHAPLDRGQSEAARQHRNAVTARADSTRNALRIANCALCDDDGYRGCTPCNHIDYRPAAVRGRALIRAELEKIQRRRVERKNERKS